MKTDTPTPSEIDQKITLQSQNAYPTRTQIWSLLGVFFLAQLPAALPMLGFRAAADSYDLPFLDTIGQTLAYTVSLLLTIWYAFRKRGSRDLSFASAPLVAYPVAAIGLIAMGIVAEPLVSATPMPDALQEMIKDMFSKHVIVSAVIAAPILEEILFRGIILDGFLKNYSPAKAIIWSGVIFGAIHLIPAQALNAAFIGIALGWVYYRTRSLWLCMFLHFVNNAVSSLEFLFEGEMDMSRNLTRVWTGNDTLYGVLLVGCAGICAGCYVYLNRILPKAQTI